MVAVALSPAGYAAGPAEPVSQPGSNVPARSNLKQLARELRATHPVPGLALAVIDGEEIFVAVDSVRRLGRPAAVREGDRSHIASVTKSLTATMIATLVEEGRLSWTSTPEQIFPELRGTIHPGYRQVTLAQISSQSAGMPPFLVRIPPSFGRCPSFGAVRANSARRSRPGCFPVRRQRRQAQPTVTATPATALRRPWGNGSATNPGRS